MTLNKLKCGSVLATILLASCGYAQTDDTLGGWLLNFNHTDGVAPVTNKIYKEECGSCHFAYQPGLLPSASWAKLLTPEALHDHFGEVADLDKDTAQAVRDYAIANAADKSYFKRSRTVVAATEGIEPPLRITDVRFIKRKHHEIPDKMIKGNKDVKTLSNCSACHTQAERGVYNADTVSIPNYPAY
jgi:hypothetical protein